MNPNAFSYEAPVVVKSTRTLLFLYRLLYLGRTFETPNGPNWKLALEVWRVGKPPSLR